MPAEDGVKLTDDEIDRRARELFAQVRAEDPEAKAGRALQSAGDAAGEVGSDVLSWLFEAGGEDEGGHHDGE
jgi:hypothetical protein